MSYKRKKTKSVRSHIVIYKIITIHITFCFHPSRYLKCIHRICISYESHNHAPFNLFFLFDLFIF